MLAFLVQCWHAELSLHHYDNDLLCVCSRNQWDWQGREQESTERCANALLILVFSWDFLLWLIIPYFLFIISFQRWVEWKPTGRVSCSSCRTSVSSWVGPAFCCLHSLNMNSNSNCSARLFKQRGGEVNVDFSTFHWLVNYHLLLFTNASVSVFRRCVSVGQ